MSNEQFTGEVCIIGAGGFSRELYQYVRDEGRLQVRGFLDDANPDLVRLPDGCRLLDRISDYKPSAGERFILALGDPGKRSQIAHKFLERGAVFETVVHPRAYVAATASIGPGSVVAPFASVGAYAVVGSLVQVHFYASVAHDAVIGDNVALSPYSVVNGGGCVGEGSFLGTRATVNPLKKVGEFSKVAAGSVVYQDVPAWSLASGNPAKSRRLLRANSGSA